MREPEFEDIQSHLSLREEATEAVMARRTFLKLLGAGVSMAAMPAWLQSAAAAPSLGDNDGVLVVIQMGGGNDGLNTLVPTASSAYYAARKSLAISQSSALDIGSGVGLHPSLSKTKALFDAGKVAIVQGVGWGSNDLSHFDCTANWMSGWAPYVAPNPSQATGWLGRYLDGLGADPLYGVNIGNQTPLHMVGQRTSASSLATSKGNLFFGGNSFDDPTTRLVDALKAIGSTSTGFGALSDSLAKTESSSIATSQMLASNYNTALPSGTLNSQMALAARLINANLGTRVYSVSWGTFDTHENQAAQHAARLAELDQAVDTFFATLGSSYANRVTLMTFSEFGRRVNVNGSNGTDHGTASPLFVIGNRVKGGLYGAYPSLTDLDVADNLKTQVDFHQVYATVLDKWLNADSKQLLGSTFTDLGIFAGPPTGAAIATPPASSIGQNPPIILAPTPSTRPITAPRSYRLVTAAGSVSGFGGVDAFGRAPSINAPVIAAAATPDQLGYWLAASDGGVFCYGGAPFHGSTGSLKLSAPMVGVSSTATGNGYWLAAADGGVFAFGDAGFFGSLGATKLNAKVVGIAASPDSKGYWLVAADGGVFAFGDAGFFGSLGATKLNAKVVGIAASPDSKGYWLVAADGGVFAFGDAGFFGSTARERLVAPICGIAVTPTGRGYRLVSQDGGVFCFGDATFEGASTGNVSSSVPVVAIAT